TEIQADPGSELFRGVPAASTVWMSHGDKVAKLPAGFATLAKSGPCEVAAAGDPKRRIYGLQFHPEVQHSEHGQQVLRNFVLGIAECKPGWSPGRVAERKVADVRALVGQDGEIVMGLSGGVDSSVAAVLIHRAIGDRLHCVFVDTGLLRQGERE